MSHFFASLRTRLSLLALIAVLPAFALLFYTDLEQRRLATAVAQAEALHLVRLISNEQEAHIAGTHQFLTVLSQLPPIANTDPASCPPILAGLLRQNTSYLNLGVATLDGNVICSALPITEPVNIQDRSYFQQAIQTQTLAVGEYQIGRISGQPSLNFGYPLIDNQGAPHGVVFAALDLNWLNQSAAAIQLPENTAFTILDAEGTILARYPDPAAWVGQHLPEAPLVQAVLAHPGEGTIQAEGIDGIPRLYAFAPLGESRAYVTIGIPSAIAFSQTNQRIINNLAWLGLTAAFILAGSWLFSSRFILQQVHTILNTTKQLAAGDLTARTGVAVSEGELNELARAFDDMAQAVAWRTDRQQHVEEMLRQSAAGFRYLFAHNPMPMWVYDRATLAFLEVNDAAVDHYGYSYEEFLQMRITDIRPPTDIPRLLEETQQERPVLQHSGLWQHRLKQGHIIDVEITSHAIEFAGRQAALVVAQDVSQRQQAEAENHRLLQGLQRHLQQLQALHTIGLAITANLDLTATLDVVLQQVVQQMGVDAAAVLLPNTATGELDYVAGHGFRGLGIKQSRLRLGEGVGGRAFSEGRPVYIANLTQTDDFQRSHLLSGEEFVTYYSLPLKAKEQVVGLLELFQRQPFEPQPEWLRLLQSLALQAAIAIDNALLFSQTRQLLHKTQEQARQVQQILENVPEGVALLNAKQKLILANQIANSYLPLLLGDPQPLPGQPLTHLAGQPLTTFLNPAQAGLVWHELELPAAQRIFQVTARPMQDNQGWLLVLRDVTEERLHQDYLQTQERLATVGQLAAGIAHDFNNIMAVITLYSGTLKHNPASPHYQSYLDTMIQQARHASNLIEQILDFSRRSVMERNPLDLLPFTKETIRLLERILPENIQLHLSHEEKSYFVHADPTRLQQVLMNLAVNARDALIKGGRLSLQLTHLNVTPSDRPPLPSMAPIPWVALSVTDTGTGITPDALPHIFEPFYTTKQPGHGTGLGLAQVYGIIKQHDGEISVESQLGQGTTFTIYLPALEKKPVAPGHELSGHVPRANGVETILLVEDNPKVAQAIRETIETLGYHVLVADNGRSALSLFEEKDKDITLVLSDMVMPYLGGVELYHLLQTRRPGVKMILTTGYPLEDEGKRLLEQGSIAWLQKPFSLSQVGQTIRRVLDTNSPDQPGQ